MPTHALFGWSCEDCGPTIAFPRRLFTAYWCLLVDTSCLRISQIYSRPSPQNLPSIIDWQDIGDKSSIKWNMGDASNSKALVLNDEGNTLLAQRKCKRAHEKYTLAIREDEKNAVLCANRSACLIAMKSLALLPIGELSWDICRDSDALRDALIVRIPATVQMFLTGGISKPPPPISNLSLLPPLQSFQWTMYDTVRWISVNDVVHNTTNKRSLNERRNRTLSTQHSHNENLRH